MNKFIIFIFSLPKTLLFNLWYLPFFSAIKLPFFVKYNVQFKRLGGAVYISDVKTGSIKIGFGDVAIFDEQNSRTIWKLSGRIYFTGKTNIGHGSKIVVSGDLKLGSNFAISAESAIVATNSIVIGDNVLVSWDALVIDTDFHKIYDSNHSQINESQPIIIGNDVWVGCRTLILKGVKISDGIVIGAQSTVSKSITNGKSIYAGNPSMEIKKNIRWEI